MIIRMMYILPMMLGRTFDVAKNIVGEDIFSPEDIAAPRVLDESFYRSNMRTVESSADVREVLEVGGGLSLDIKSGAVEARGIGAYLKAAARATNAVDLLIKVSFRTVSKSLPHSARPVPGWSERSPGTHFVQSVLYGGDLIACVRFKAARAEDLQDIRAVVKASLSAGSVLDLVGGEELELLDKELKQKATMEISYFATVPLEGIPNTIEGLRDLVVKFEDHVRKVGNGIGVPVEVELAELSAFDSKFQFIKNLELETELEFFEEYLDDVISTKFHIHAWLNDLPGTLNKEEEKQIAQFGERLRVVQRAFTKTIANLDLAKGSSQLEDAKEAYREGKGLGMAGKFRREWNKILKKIGSKLLLPEDQSSVYTQFGSSSCSGDERSTSMLFPGYLASSPRNVIGAGHDYLCLPQEPPLPLDTPSAPGGTLAGVKYGMLEAAPFKVKERDTVLKGVVCAVCMVKRSTNMAFYGLKDCPNTWHLQYKGFLMAATDIERSQNICVDSRLESHQESYMGPHDQSINFAIAKLDKISFVPCVMCSK